ncbi:MAG: family 10 glycosylhydrolase [Nitrospirae bacterium]|nr:family 10 glycosylhydrolase [Candidatus Manganitrophaceae bacterium]
MASFKIICFSSLKKSQRLSVVFLFCFLLAGCIGPVTRSAPQDPQGWGELVEGVRSFEAGRYIEARRRSLNIIESYPGSPLLGEAQWLLAKSYDATGEKEAAIRELRLYLRNYPNSTHEEEAHAYLFRLAQADPKTIAITWAPASGRGLEEALRRFKKWGANAVILPVVDNSIGRGGLFFNSPGAPVSSDRVGEWAETAHRMGYRMIAQVPLREIRWATLLHPEWRDQKFDPKRGTVQPIEKLDLFHPEVREMILRMYRDLGAYPIDGIYIEDLSYPAEEGWSPSAIRLYEGLFFEPLGPNDLLEVRGGLNTDGRGRTERAPQFWHWVGWRSRHMTDLLKELQGVVHSVHPGVEWGIALPEMLVTQPMRGLEENSLDLLDLKRAPTDFYLFASTPGSLGTQTLVERLSRYHIQPQEVWLHQRASGTASPSEMGGFSFRGLLLVTP